jgi:hypothetical protein
MREDEQAKAFAKVFMATVDKCRPLGEPDTTSMLPLQVQCEARSFAMVFVAVATLAGGWQVRLDADQARVLSSELFDLLLQRVREKQQLRN